MSIQTESQEISIEPQYFIYLGQGKFGCFGIEIAKKTGGTGTSATYTSGEVSSELRLARIYIQDSDLTTLNQLDEYDLFSGSHVYFTDNLKVLYYDLII